MGLPIVFVELGNLLEKEVPKSAIKFSTLTMDGGAAVTIAGPEKMHMIRDVREQPVQTRQWATSVDAAVLCGAQMALRKGRVLQVFDMTERAKVASTSLPDEDAFVRWLGPGVLGVVVAGTVLVWEVGGEEAGGGVSGPSLEFELDPLMGGSVQITSLKASPGLDYICVGGLTVVNGHINGLAQLYSRADGVSVPLQAHAFDFALHPEHPDVPLLYVSARPPGVTAGSLSILPLPLGEHTHLGTSGSLFFFSESDNDFPVATWASPARSVVYTVSKFGFLFINELTSGATVYTNRISDSTVFVSGIYPTGEFVGVNVAGQILLVDLNFAELESHITYVLCNPSLLPVFTPLIQDYLNPGVGGDTNDADADDALTTTPTTSSTTAADPTTAANPSPTPPTDVASRLAQVVSSIISTSSSSSSLEDASLEEVCEMIVEWEEVTEVPDPGAPWAPVLQLAQTIDADAASADPFVTLLSSLASSSSPTALSIAASLTFALLTLSPPILTPDHISGLSLLFNAAPPSDTPLGDILLHTSTLHTSTLHTSTLHTSTLL